MFCCCLPQLFRRPHHCCPVLREASPAVTCALVVSMPFAGWVLERGQLWSSCKRRRRAVCGLPPDLTLSCSPVAWGAAAQGQNSSSSGLWQGSGLSADLSSALGKGGAQQSSGVRGGPSAYNPPPLTPLPLSMVTVPSVPYSCSLAQLLTELEAASSSPSHPVAPSFLSPHPILHPVALVG